MRTLSASLSTEIAKTTDGAFRWLVEIRAIGWGTRYLSTEDRTITNIYSGEIIDISPMYEAVGALPDVSLELLDNADNRAVARVGARVDVLLWPVGGAEGDADTTFKGEITGPIVTGGGSIRFDCVSWARRQLDREVTAVLSADDYASADPDDIGKYRPVCYGSISEVPCLAVDAGSISTLTNEIDADDTTVELSDASGFASSGTIQIDSEQMTYAGKSGNELTGITRSTTPGEAVAHAVGAVVAEVQTQYDWMAADHAIQQFGEVYVQGTRQTATITTLDGAITDSDTTITVDSVTGFADSGSVLIVSEWIFYAAISGLDLTGCTRGANGTTAAAHADASQVNAYPFQLRNDEGLVRWFTLPTLERQPLIDIDDGRYLDDPGHAHSTTGGGTYTLTVDTCASVAQCDCAGGDQVDGDPATFGTISGSGGQCNYTTTVGGPTTGLQPVSVTCQIKASTATGSASHILLLNGQLFADGSQFGAHPGSFVTNSVNVSSWSQVATLFINATGGAQFRIYEVQGISVTYINLDVGSSSTGVELLGTSSLTGNSVADTLFGNVTVDLNGWADDGSGTVTGTPNALIQRPDHVMIHVLRQYGAATAAETALADFDDFTGDELAVYLGDRATVRGVRDSIDDQCRALTVFSGDRWLMHKRPDAGPTPDATLTEADVLRFEDGRSSVNVGRAGLDQIVNRYPWQAGQYPDATWSLAGTEEVAYSQTEYGVREQPLFFPWVFDSAQVQDVLDWRTGRDATPERRLVSALVSLGAYELELGDVVRLNHDDGTDVTGELVAISERMLVGGSNGSMRISIDEDAAPTVEAVVWTGGVNVTADGNNLEKTGGVDGVWDAGAVSSKAIQSGDGWCRTEMADILGRQAIGLSNGDTNQHPDDIDFSFRIVANLLFVYENANLRLTWSGTLATGDLLYVRIDGGTVKYYVNAELIYTSAGTPSYPLLVDTSIWTAGEIVNDVYLSGTLA